MGRHLVAAPGGHRVAAEAIHHTLRSTKKTDGSLGSGGLHRM
jgi:hypothetical protein